MARGGGRRSEHPDQLLLPFPSLSPAAIGHAGARHADGRLPSGDASADESFDRTEQPHSSAKGELEDRDRGSRAPLEALPSQPTPSRRVPASELCPFRDPSTRAALERFRLRFEAKRGPTDTSRVYSSQLPQDVQDWLFENHPQVYFNTLPPFVRSFLSRRVIRNARNGQLDDVADGLLRLFVRNGGSLSRRRRRQRD